MNHLQTSDREAITGYLEAAPKAELHVHLEGAINPATLLTLAKRNHVSLPVSNLEEMREWFHFRDFAHFIEMFFTISQCLKTEEDYELIAYEFGAEMARQNVRIELFIRSCALSYNRTKRIGKQNSRWLNLPSILRRMRALDVLHLNSTMAICLR